MKKSYLAPKAEFVMFAPVEGIAMATTSTWFWGIYEKKDATSVTGINVPIWSDPFNTDNTGDTYKIND